MSCYEYISRAHDKLIGRNLNGKNSQFMLNFILTFSLND